jgi:anti-sigma factor RsiW
MNEPAEKPAESPENFVAYLDGELNEDAARKIERTLSESAEVRKKVDQLARTWDMLDCLPNTRASEQFTHRTMSSIQVAISDQQIARRWWVGKARQIKTVFGWSAGLVVAAAVGFFITNRWLPTESDRLIQELPIVENLDRYSEIGRVDYLKQLQQSGLFNDGPSDKQ